VPFGINGTLTTTSVPDNFPRGKLTQSGIMPISYNGRSYWHIGLKSGADLTGGITTASFTNATFSPQQAWQIDSKMDDGAPNSGAVMARILGGSPSLDDLITPATGSATSCYDSTDTTYNITGDTANTPSCMMQFRWNG
jgi:hypothetical protein